MKEHRIISPEDSADKNSIVLLPEQQRSTFFTIEYLTKSKN
jgi:hypothetical protein